MPINPPNSSSTSSTGLSITTAILIAIGLVAIVLITPHLIVLISQITNPEMFLRYCQSAPELLTEPGCVTVMMNTGEGIEPVFP